ncbi:hypothetical protein [Streptomyces sp. PTD5-9]|uniref:hypothetical protein n=1 Tax=Streptomyces sp. PTD5-9 TaxID=3120150 RepID=UPI0030088A58
MRRGTLWFKSVLLAAVAAGGAVLYLGWGTLPDFVLAAVAGPLLVAAVLLVAVLVDSGSEKSNVEVWVREQAEALEEHPWQVWPCRLEEATEGEADVARPAIALLDSAGRRAINGPRFTRVLLLAPDGSVARSYVAYLPGEVWHGMVDGMGAVWVCGDLRFRVVLATPGADVCWLGAPIPEPPRQRATQNDVGVIADIAREAGRAAVSYWLG